MKATEELVHTHQLVSKILEIFATDQPRFQESMKTLQRAVEAHAWLQDEILLPALDGKPLIDKAFLSEIVQEHRDLDSMIGRLQAIPPDQLPDVQASVLQIRVLLQTHFQKEADALYPLVEQVLKTDELVRLRDEMDRRKLVVRAVTQNVQSH